MFQHAPLFFTSISSLTLSIISIASNEPLIPTDAVLYDTKRQRLYPSVHSYIHPFYDTTSHSQPLASYNCCLHMVLFCAVSCQLLQWKSLAAHSCTPSSHLKLGLATGQLQVNSDCLAFLGIWLRGSLCTCPTHCSL